MDVKIWSRIKMLEFINKHKDEIDLVNIISIHGVFSPPIFKEKSKNILQLKFDDIIPVDLNHFSPHERQKYTLFDENHAKEIIDFLKIIDVEKPLLINCMAGQCRSAAIGVYAQAKLGTIKETGLLFNTYIIDPNEHVLSILNKVSPLPENIFEEIKGFIKNNPYLLQKLF